MRPIARFPTVVAVLLAATCTVRAETYVGGVIDTDTTWDLAGSPYVVTVAAGGSIVVGSNATLTIEPGVEVRFEPLQALLVGWSAWGPGTLVARGTAPSPILFTSDQSAPGAGDWGRIDFLDQATDATFDAGENYLSGCILEHVIVEYAGSGDYAAVNVDQSAPYLTYCEVRENLERGIALYSATPLRIENCYIHDNQDGGIYFQSSYSNTLTGNTISGNSAHDGSGIYFHYSDSNTLTGNTISGNSSTGGGRGGGIYLRYSDSNTLIGNTISGNGPNGGIYFYESNSNTLTDNTISGNSTDYYGGSGIYFHYSDSNTLTGNTISGNSSTGGGSGGGIYLRYSDSNTLTGNTISGNSADGAGGGIIFSDSDSNTLTNNNISGNSAGGGGGGIYLYASYSNTLSGNNISGNTADGDGGGIYFYASNSNTLTGNTIRFNHTTAGETGGIFVTDGTQWLSLNGGAQAYNIICYNDGYEVYNNNSFYGGDARHDIDASNVYWCTDDTDVIRTDIYDFFDDASRAMVVWSPYVWPPPGGDLDGDDDVDLYDFAEFATCLNGPDVPYPAGCDDADLDPDGDVDLADYAQFEEMLTGPL